MSDLRIVFWSSLTTLFCTLIVVYATHRLQMARDMRGSERDARLRAYATLMGQELMVTQLYVSRFEAFIFSDYHEALWRIAGLPEDSVLFQELIRWQRKSEDLVMEVAKAHRELFEAVASVRVVFPRSAKLMELTEAVYGHKVPTLLVRGNKLTNVAELEAWRTAAVQQVLEQVHQSIEGPISELVGHLTQCIDAYNGSWWWRLRAGLARRILRQ